MTDHVRPYCFCEKEGISKDRRCYSCPLNPKNANTDKTEKEIEVSQVSREYK